MLQTIKTNLVNKKELAPGAWLLRFGLTDPTQILFSPGQYLTIAFKDKYGNPINRAYSIASQPNQLGYFELLIHFLPGGLASTYFSSIKLNSEVVFKGPAGVFGIKNPDKNIIFLVTGTGIAPIRSILPSLLKNPRAKQVNLFWGLPTKKDICLFDELMNLSINHPNFSFKICLSKETIQDNKHLRVGRVNTIYQNLCSAVNFKDYDHYLCGARDIVESLKIFLFSTGLSSEQIFFEKF